MKIVVHPELCMASGFCMLECPELFGRDETGFVVLIHSEPSSGLHDAARQAAAACPTGAIEILTDP